MILRIQDVLSKGMPQPFHASLDVSDLLKGRKDVLEAGPLAVRLDALPEARVVRLEGEMSIDVAFACSRCLEPANEHLDIAFSERFKLAVPESAAPPEEDVIVVEEDKFDLEPYLEEALLLHLPFVPLCSDTCKGLCPQCGVNRNETDCSCSGERIDPRMAALKDLFKD
ncbi:YceD family protein [Paenibacillus sp. 1P07SE]|uniref:YceD family protein n=1 Tax=Paenibacillus sp. 1P07SE TaxID=3132209 RepID=UPI0039A71E48